MIASKALLPRYRGYSMYEDAYRVLENLDIGSVYGFRNTRASSHGTRR